MTYKEKLDQLNKKSLTEKVTQFLHRLPFIKSWAFRKNHSAYCNRMSELRLVKSLGEDLKSGVLRECEFILSLDKKSHQLDFEIWKLKRMLEKREELL